jgi:hypothetical protein
VEGKHQVESGQEWNAKIFKMIKQTYLWKGSEGDLKGVKEGVNCIGYKKQNYIFSMLGIVFLPQQ